MIRLGRVYSNLMTDMPMTNAKLSRRGITMVELAAGVSRARAEEALREAEGEVKTAVVMAARGIDAAAARERLASVAGNLREALES
jgi:N-acetylmuramic acid 6-phosphate etherase